MPFRVAVLPQAMFQPDTTWSVVKVPPTGRETLLFTVPNTSTKAPAAVCTLALNSVMESSKLFR